VRIYGIDFTCAPRRAKPITVASGVLDKRTLSIEEIEKLENFSDFEAFLRRTGPWIGGFDFPFSLPRELVRDLGWPAAWVDLVEHCSAFTRPDFRKILDAYRNSRPAGGKYAHRATDYPAGSSSPMKLVNPPVALMFHEGARRMIQSGVHVPALMPGDLSRIALEAYPGLLVRKQLGRRDSYKSDTRSEHTAARKEIRRSVLQALRSGHPLGIRLRTRLDKLLVGDGSGDALDAAICAVQAAWAAGQPNYGLPEELPEGEGWIVSAGFTGTSSYPLARMQKLASLASSMKRSPKGSPKGEYGHPANGRPTRSRNIGGPKGR
jgi:hypothetical protein